MLTRRCYCDILVLGTLMFGIGPCLGGEVRLPQVFSDGMILQREMKVPVWGWGDDGEKVTVLFNGQTKSAKVVAGKWRIDLDPMQANTTPQSLIVESGADRRQAVIRNVLVGEVWFTCGQSNMVMNLAQTTGGQEFFKRHHSESDGLIRVVSQGGPPLMGDSVREDVPASWREPTPSFSAVSYYFAQQLFSHFDGNVPVGILCYTNIVPAEAWVDAGRIASHPNLKHLPKHPLKVASKGYNGTIAPLSPFAIRGVVYYQAEYNGGRYKEFRYLFPALIASWREAWDKPDLPFLFVQLPGFLYHTAGKSRELDMDAATLARQKRSASYQWVGMRDVQRWVWQNTAHTGLASAVDLGEKYDIHPKNKEPLGTRLLACARKVAYGEDAVDSGPWPKSFETNGSKVVIHYDHVGGGLVARTGALTGFVIAGLDNNFVPATAVIDGDTIVVSADGVEEPIHVRYAWEGFPACSLYNREGLPALPFSYSVPGKTFYPSTAKFELRNPSFEEQADGAPLLWGPVTGEPAGTVLTTSKASDGKCAAKILPGGRVTQEQIADQPGYYWNADPSTPHFLRPGCIAGYCVDLASDVEGEPVKAYMNLAATKNAGGYATWGGVRMVSSSSVAFSKRCVVHRMTDKGLGGHVNWRNSAGGRWINQSKTTALLLDNFSPVRIIRPLLQVNSEGPLRLNTPIVIGNAQDGTLPEKLTADGMPVDVPTLLYGCASFAPDERGIMQQVVEPTDNVGAVLIGRDADKFELAGSHASADGKSVKLIGTDGKPGLLGGKTPETETFSVRLRQGKSAGSDQVAVRIVTQAVNVGTLSRGERDEPPLNLYYLDLPVQVR